MSSTTKTTKAARTLKRTAALILLLESSEDHLGSGNVLGGVQQVLEERIVVPGDSWPLRFKKARHTEPLALLAAE
jgi:hypothetical protein